MHQRRVRRLPAVVEQRVDVALGELRLEPVGEFRDARIGVLRRRAEIRRAQIVRDLARTNHHHVLVTQRPQRAADCEVMRGVRARLDRQLRDRHVGVREHQQHRHPRTVIEAVLERRGRDARRVQEVGRMLRDVGRAGRRVADFVERARKAVEVVNRVRMRGNARDGLLRAPVRGQHQHRARARQFGTEFGECAGRQCRIDRQRRRAMRQVKRRQAVHVGGLLKGCCVRL
ncbi:hypothetical protein FEP71_05157 [Burkholderia multivorans]|nr:hypothetical protein [Burkholderia multivorans]